MTPKKSTTDSRAGELSEKLQRLAETRCAEQGKRLTPARLNAYVEMMAYGRPLSAYELLALMEKREKRKIAPLTVYRHLDFLMQVGLVHRLESTQSYLTCTHPEHAHESQYLVCSSCGHVDELESHKLSRLLEEMTLQKGFHADKAVVELAGLCQSCLGEAG